MRSLGHHRKGVYCTYARYSRNFGLLQNHGKRFVDHHLRLDFPRGGLRKTCCALLGRRSLSSFEYTTTIESGCLRPEFDIDWSTMLMSEWMRMCSLLVCREDTTRIARERPDIGHDTISLIYEQLYARQVAKTFYLIRMHGKAFVERYQSGQSLTDIAERFNLSPSLVARKVLELHLGLNRRAITQLMRDPSSINDERLRQDIALCVEMDEHCSPRLDRLRTALGLEYELRLTDEVKNLGLEFETENQLRHRGCHKTPDILLCVPVLIRNKVVRWIDSKAKFGDEYTLNKDYVSSVSSYIGRFGAGMVVYWFGFIEDCDSRMLQDNGLLITEIFPTEIELLPGSSRFEACLGDDEANESEEDEQIPDWEEL